MALRLFNSRSRSLELFVPIEAAEVSIYVCGMTPSWHPHIGHARTFLTFDVLRRHLMAKGRKATYVQNITDIDDKIIERAAAEHEPWEAIVRRYYGEYEACARRLGLLEPDVSPRATEHVPAIIAMIRGLVESGAAYETSDGVYFAVERFPAYGRLSNRQIDELRAGARIAVREEKHDWLDFALWKKQKPGEPAWPSPWGDGRPGWHIECSALAREYLGDQFDIHGGASDLIFPHHENEIAQTESLTAREPMARIWMHAGLVMVDGQKMSKSLGNFLPLTTLLDRYPAAAIRFLFLQTGYRKPTNFTEDAVEAAVKGLRGLYAELDALRLRSSNGRPALSGGSSDSAFDDFEAYLDDDLNTAGALGWLQKTMRGGLVTPTLVDRCLNVLGLPLRGADAGFDSPSREVRLDEPARRALRELTDDRPASDAALVERVLALRGAARTAKDFATSDKLRAALAAAGISIKDTKDGTDWSLDGHR
ncbi:MAG: cysteine--tRNA ligase [Candidatus Eremiobacteraeota bacterium]|nr:cysteine--tRNA ligase [Candidatus Eremiobacteraeota bacterium]MBC5826492.1 cysteine--tRNA ligase [Candidatus Eremiobacteraeota bacterium]